MPEELTDAEKLENYDFMMAIPQGYGSDPKPSEGEIFSYLLNNDLVWIRNGDYSPKNQPNIFVCHFRCDDCFQWASGETFEVTPSNIREVFEYVKKDPDHGGDMYWIRQNKLMPQKPLYDIMINSGIWIPEDFDGLAPNEHCPYWKRHRNTEPKNTNVH